MPTEPICLEEQHTYRTCPTTTKKHVEVEVHEVQLKPNKGESVPHVNCHAN